MLGKATRRFSVWCVLVLFLFLLALGLVLQPTNSSLASPEPPVPFSQILSDGQFVYGPNVGDFELEAYLQASASHLLPYLDSLFFWSLYPSINPKVLLTLIEMRSALVTARGGTEEQLQNPIGFSEGGFDKQLEQLSRALTRAYYWHLLNYSPKPAEARPELRVKLIDGSVLSLPAQTNAGTFAIAEALAGMSTASELMTILDKSSTAGFYQTYLRLFVDDDPLDDSNQIDVLASPPSDLLQLPYPVGQSWSFNGVHDWAGNNGGSDMSSIDFSDGWPGWGVDTSNMWVVAAGPGSVQKLSNCWVRLNHADGWTTSYYHLENVQVSGGSVSRNQRLANLANTFQEATCNGGTSPGPHVHFSLLRNGAYVAINGTSLSGWMVHSGRYPYDTNCQYMYLERDAQKKCAFQTIYNDGIPGGTCSAPSLNSPNDGYVHTSSDRTITFSWSPPSNCSPDGYTFRVKTVSNMDSGGTTIFDEGQGGTQVTKQFGSQWDNTDLYWSVRACKPCTPFNPGPWAPSRRFRIEPGAPPPSGNWHAKYFDNQQCQDPNCSTTPRCEEDFAGPFIDKFWGTGAPCGMNGDYWGALFTGRFNFSGGNYVFHIDHDDGARLFLDGQCIQEVWNETGLHHACPPRYLSGEHDVAVAYRENTGDAKLHLWWDTDASHCVQDAAEFVGQCPYPTVQAGQQFSIYFEVRNTGNTTWRDSDGYGLENLNGVTLGAWFRQEIGADVPPGATKRWDIQMTAPSTPGTYTTDWMLKHWSQTFGPYMYIDVTVVSQLSAPTLLYPDNGSSTCDSTPYFDWSSVSGASSYRFEVDNNSGFTSPEIVTHTSSSNLTPASPLPSGTYYWRVRASNSSGEGPWSSAWSFTIDSPPPSAPSLVWPLNGTETCDPTPYFNWASVSADSYRIQVDNNSDFSSPEINNPTSSSDYTHGSPLSPGTYYWRVRASNSCGDGPWSSTWSFTILSTSELPTGTVLINGGASYTNHPNVTLTLSASSPSSTVTEMQFAIYNSNTSEWEWYGWYPYATTWPFTLPSGDEWKVLWARFRDAKGCISPWALDAIGLDTTVPVSSINPLPATSDPSVFSVYWTGSDNLSGLHYYDVQYRDGLAGEWTDWWTNLDPSYGGRTFWGGTGHTYYFRIRAEDRAENLEPYPSGDGDAYTYVTCSEDAYDAIGDDDYPHATFIATDGTVQTHSFCGTEDEDWIKFNAQAGKGYRIETSNLGQYSDTYIYLYDVDGSTLITENDDIQRGVIRSSRIIWRAPSNGTYFVRVIQWEQAAEYENPVAGTNVTYDISVDEQYLVYLPLVMRNSTGVATVSQTPASLSIEPKERRPVFIRVEEPARWDLRLREPVHLPPTPPAPQSNSKQ